jgi:hypothetical protein
VYGETWCVDELQIIIDSGRQLVATSGCSLVVLSLMLIGGFDP